MRSLRALVLAGEVAVGVLVVLAIVSYPPPSASFHSPWSRCGSEGGPALWTRDVTGSLAPSFSNGSVQAFGSNGSSVIFGGVSYYDRSNAAYDSLPALGSFNPRASLVHDLTRAADPYFHEGGVFPVAWNGTAWLLAGQATVNGAVEGVAVSLDGNRIVDLTSRVAPYFQGQGIWIGGWDGQGWLLGGNSSNGASLVYLEAGTVTDLTAVLPHNGPNDWVQMVAWNGTGWLVGGQGVFGAWQAGRYVDLLPGSPFAGGGVFGMDWNGSSWLVGGSPAVVAVVRGAEVTTVATPANGTSGAWVNSVVADGPSDWLVSGGAYVTGGYAPFFSLVHTTDALPSILNESACLSGAFAGGWVQYGAWAPSFGARTLLLTGEGGTNETTFTSHAAAVAIFVGA